MASKMLPDQLHIFKEGELYEEKYLGNGGFGLVVRRKWKRGSEIVHVAEKKLVTYSNNNDRVNLHQEAKILNSVRHEHIVKLFGLRFTSDRQFCLVMEYVKHGSCNAFFRQKLAPRVASLMDGETALFAMKYRIALQVAKTMEYLHGLSPKRMLHLDLKAANVLLDELLNVKICDFGLAEMHTVSRITKLSAGNPHNRGGTCTHIAPEHLEDPNCEPSTKSDVYSFGIFLWELLMDKEPYEHALRMESLKLNVIEGKRPDTKGFSEKTPKALIDILQRAWQGRKEDRPEFTVICNALAPMPYEDSLLERIARTLAIQDTNSISNSTQSEGEERRHLEHYLGRPQFFATEDLTTPKGLVAQQRHSLEPNLAAQCKYDDKATLLRDSGNDTLESQPSSASCYVQESDVTFESGRESLDAPLISRSGSAEVSAVAAATPGKRLTKKRCCIFGFTMLAVLGGVTGLVYFLVMPRFCPALFAGDHQQMNCDRSSKSGSLPVGTNCTFSCSDGFGVRNGVRQLHCEVSGWSPTGEPPICSKLGICADLKTPANQGQTTCSNRFYEMSVCRFSCLTDYRLRIIGSGTASNSTTCVTIGGDINRTTWSNPVPYCEKVVACVKLKDPEYGSYLCRSPLIDERTNGTTCSIQCSKGMSPSGSPFPTLCRDDGTWNDTTQLCEAACPILEPPSNGTMNCTHGHFANSVCTFSCSRHFILLGSTVTSCKGVRWNYPPPDCVCPSCRFGDTCQYDVTWSSLQAKLPNTSLPQTLTFAGHRIKCYEPAKKFNFSCMCVDVPSNRGRQCRSAVQHQACISSLSTLIYLEAHLKEYPLPCDADKMPIPC